MQVRDDDRGDVFFVMMIISRKRGSEKVRSNEEEEKRGEVRILSLPRILMVVQGDPVDE